MEQKDINESVETLEPQTESSIGETQVAYTFKDFLKMIGKHWVALVLAALLGLAGGVVYGRYVQKPKYEASSSLYILNNEVSDKANDRITYAKNMARIASNYMTQTEVKEVACKLLTGDLEYKGKENSFEGAYTPYGKYAVFAKTNDNNEKVYDTTALGKCYKVTLEQFNTSDTSIFLHINTTTKNEELSIDVANAVVSATMMLTEDEESSPIAKELKGYIHCMAPANSATNTATKTYVLAIIGTLLGAILGAAYGILRVMLSTRVATKKELEIITGIKVIGMIPNYIEKEDSTQSTLEKDDAEHKVEKEGK